MPSCDVKAHVVVAILVYLCLFVQTVWAFHISGGPAFDWSTRRDRPIRVGTDATMTESSRTETNEAQTPRLVSKLKSFHILFARRKACGFTDMYSGTPGLLREIQ